MPKETIRDYNDSTAVEVGWTRDVDARISIHFPNKTIAFIDIDPATGEGSIDKSETFNCLQFNFEDRRQINDLIRNLRRARDNAYGRDE